MLFDNEGLMRPLFSEMVLENRQLDLFLDSLQIRAVEYNLMNKRRAAVNVTSRSITIAKRLFFFIYMRCNVTKSAVMVFIPNCFLDVDKMLFSTYVIGELVPGR